MIGLASATRSRTGEGITSEGLVMFSGNGSDDSGTDNGSLEMRTYGGVGTACVGGKGDNNGIEAGHGGGGDLVVGGGGGTQLHPSAS